MTYFVYSLGLVGLAVGFSLGPTPVRVVIVCAFALHLLVGLLRAARLGRWWSFFSILGYYSFLGLLFPKVSSACAVWRWGPRGSSLCSSSALRFWGSRS
ncbi:MAG: hypothetical protein DWQ36_08345 [Acidobacteria bacterium]|nr:MAG: hypothetical protein DWQ30_02070 [Acidobacteriota bacterium]REK08816.1 MAG: hypothetical protein DWQ36_08345 [Acidobacteriota bacterium]